MCSCILRFIFLLLFWKVLIIWSFLGRQECCVADSAQSALESSVSCLLHLNIPEQLQIWCAQNYVYCLGPTGILVCRNRKKFIIRFMCNLKRPWMLKTILENKNKVEESYFLISKHITQLQQRNQGGIYWQKNREWTSGIKLIHQKETLTNNLQKDAMITQWGKSFLCECCTRHSHIKY